MVHVGRSGKEIGKRVYASVSVVNQRRLLRQGFVPETYTGTEKDLTRKK